MNFFIRLQGVFFNPKEIFTSIAEKKPWKDALVVLLIVIAVFTYLIQPISQQDSINTFKNNIELKDRIGEERFNKMLDQMQNPSKVQKIIQSFVMTPVVVLLGLLLSAAVIMVMGRMTSTEGKYVQIFSSYIHAGFIDKILGGVVRLIMIFTSKTSLGTTTSLALFFPKLEALSLKFIILSQFDFFQLWMFWVLGYALSSIFKITFKKALFISYGFWVLKSLLNIGIGLLSLSFMG
ncbi:MAG: YIP1 family protein [Candidatus Aminicenantes bacterium]|nr:YIP1 family protein [Candidatus Aminicenantes bacterium]